MEELRNLKSLKQRLWLEMGSNPNDQEICKKVALIELNIAILEIQRGELLKALSNLESARRFISRISGA